MGFIPIKFWKIFHVVLREVMGNLGRFNGENMEVTQGFIGGGGGG